MKTEKRYSIKTVKHRMSGGNRESLVENKTLSELIDYFGYTLEVGNSWNRKINRQPKTIRSFVSNLQKSYEEKEASCYDRTHVELVKA